MQSNNSLYVVLTAIFLLLCMIALLSGKSSSVAMEGERSYDIEVHVIDDVRLKEEDDMGVRYVKGIDMRMDEVVYEVSELATEVVDLHTKSMKSSDIKRFLMSQEMMNRSIDHEVK